MKHLLSILAAGFAATAIFSSCDSVSEPDRFIPAEVTANRAILIEEFTGQLCTNCPDGHQAIKEIMATLGDSVVPVGIHASNLAINPPTGLRTATGEEYYKAVGSPALPTAVINMQTNPVQVSDWGEAINKLIMTPTPFTVKADASISGNTYNIKVAYSSGQDYKGKLMVWILENDIVGIQIDHGKTIPDYVHSHVFRAAVTPDVWGLDVDLTAHKAEYSNFEYEITDSSWDKSNLYVVAFLYNDGGVAQVTSTHQ